MEINDIKIFYEVANLSSTMKTANKLGYVQSNVSKRIAKLESEIGKNLFHRTNKGMKLTTDGEIFLSYAEKVLTAFSDMEEVFSISKNQVRIGATQSISKNYLQNYYFNENVSIFTKSSSELIQQLKDCTIDFMIVNKEVDNIGFKEIKTMEEKVLWTKAKRNNNDFFDNKIIISRDIDCPYRIETLDYLKKNKLDNMTVVEVDTIDILISMIENNKAMAILPERTIALNDKLKAIVNLNCNEVMLHVYALQNNATQFEIELSISD
ncbi:LysR family transcriptional regulator [Clostridium sp.]|uniref:LysR family transcriptional regulator n=1 Tax=Clostridium sp. TaxID=1506 RepID=UPI00283BE816|nr:LysR family transcriptional regulator [Clostridium sp.]MDR3595655.1 LysR family transcriptional regulator [Clostridium sp.]